ncbi:MAG TPA: hypothetical protein DCO77_01265 [Nitrospiraceae bacterium]|nr:hypothetical protein [Nitrospiraceae bacterium]
MIKFDLFTVISGFAIVIMFIALWQAIDYRSSVPGGVVGKTWKLITRLIGLFFFGYLATPFYALLTQEVKDLIVACIFFFGAIYVLLTVRLVHKIITVMKGE